MIVDRLENSNLYCDIDEKFLPAFNFLKGLQNKPLSEGKYNILENGAVYASVFSYCTCSPDDLRYEQHQKYIDLHYIISGEEKICWSGCHGIGAEYNAEEDVAFCKAEPPVSSMIHMKPGMFMVLFPDDLHKPKCIVSEPQKVEKVVIKILL